MARSQLAPTRLASRTVSAFWLDALLLVLLLLIQSPRLTGVWAHETLGLAIVVPLVLHLLLSWHWIIAKGKRLGAGASWRSRCNYALNAALFVAAVVTIISGVLDSEAVLPAMGFHVIQDATWYETHDYWSTVLFVTIGLHLAMNWGWVDAVVRRRAFTAQQAETTQEDDSEATG